MDTIKRGLNLGLRATPTQPHEPFAHIKSCRLRRPRRHFCPAFSSRRARPWPGPWQVAWLWPAGHKGDINYIKWETYSWFCKVPHLQSRFSNPCSWPAWSPSSTWELLKGFQKLIAEIVKMHGKYLQLATVQLKDGIFKLLFVILKACPQNILWQFQDHIVELRDILLQGCTLDHMMKEPSTISDTRSETHWLSWALGWSQLGHLPPFFDLALGPVQVLAPAPSLSPSLSPWPCLWPAESWPQQQVLPKQANESKKVKGENIKKQIDQPST